MLFQHDFIDFILFGKVNIKVCLLVNFLINSQLNFLSQDKDLLSKNKSMSFKNPKEGEILALKRTKKTCFS